MQSKGFIRVIAVLLAIVCLFYLSFSLVTNNVENDAAASAQKTAAAAAVKVDKDTKSEAYRHVYDSVYNKAYAKYLKDIGQEEVYMWYTYNEVREKQIGLGLDLKGGMTVTLQISVADIVRSKATNPQDAKLNEALAYASENPENVCRASALRRNSTAWTASMPTTAIPQSKAFCARKHAATFPNPSTSFANVSTVSA